MLLGVADGVSQLEDYGIDASKLPIELLKVCESQAMQQLIPTDARVAPQDSYRGPVALLKEAYESTDSLGSTTVLLAVLDNSTRIHGKLHPMVAVTTIGDCELMMLRRIPDRSKPFQTVFYTEMQRIDGHAQTPLQVARVDERIDADFHDGLTIEVIERGSAVHCVSAYEGDVVVMGSDGVFDNLYLDEIIDIVNKMMPPEGGEYRPINPQVLQNVATAIIQASHAKTHPGAGGELREAPIGRGGKMDDTSCVVAEVVPWTPEHTKEWVRQQTWIPEPFGLGFCNGECVAQDDDEEEEGEENHSFE